MSPGRKLFEQHVNYLANNDIEGMVKNTFTEDAVMFHNYPFFEGKPPYIFKGHQQIIEATKTILAPQNQGKIQASKPFNFVENEGFLGFQLIVISPNTGKWIITDAWTIENGKLSREFTMGYNLKE